MAELTRRVGADVRPVEAAEFDGDILEARALASLAVRSLAGLPLVFRRQRELPGQPRAAHSSNARVNQFLINYFQVISV
jgi:1,6-anhydro-N-acetylmuramate kinase